ncbi:MAG: hypothetical protein M3083_11475 [Actinomycetota bacterium]|nr:hypothetical protein [Actinomycetota bacterium]
MALGLIDIEGDRIAVRNPRFLEIGADLAALGVPLDEVVEEYARLQHATVAIAERFTQLFERHLWAPFLDAGLPRGDIRELISVLQRLSALAEGVVALTLSQSLKRAAASFLTSQQVRLDGAGVLGELRPLAAAAGLDLSDG